MAPSSTPSAAIAVNRPVCAGPVVVSVPHAGRIYPSALIAAARVDQKILERLEDRWCDRVANDASGAGATVVQALWARAVADCNRGEGQMAPAEVAVALRPQFSAPGRKERAGLGVVPTRLAESGPLWRRPIDAAELAWRLEGVHRPYHIALEDELDVARRRHGHAVLIDLHSMPPIPAGQPGHGARIVVGDCFGESCDDWLTELVVGMATSLDVAVTRNQPYAGGHIVRRHGRPARQVHAVQIEIDRTLYLTPDRLPDVARTAWLARWFATLVGEAGQAFPRNAQPIAAE
ncbi:MAG: N-formylglutamate amidohydrolase [Sphingopyxis sp.]|uniref:N-formylglutamate amidohydrolase n=1 Tax=Sphingopyxis sp. TaxID=1908224 RepID=UPI002AB8A59E|nr:N-formylglutamate amidohydrolase [Sphingopyxis sp.]MDZ3830980.1 N-formylglutamate amidohydrolase [Sphingopyxis sp.]